MNEYSVFMCLKNKEDDCPVYKSYDVSVSEEERKDSYQSEIQIACMKGVERLIYNYNLVPGSKIEIMSAVCMEKEA